MLRAVAPMVPITHPFCNGREMDGAPSFEFHMNRSLVSVPDRISLGVAQREGVVSFYYFPRQDQVSFALLDL